MNFYNKWYERSTRLGLKIKSTLFLVALSLLATITEIFGVGMFLPIFQYIRVDGDVNNLIDGFPMWGYAVDFFNMLNIDISLVVLLIFAFIFFSLRQFFNYLRIIYRSKMGQNLTRMLRNTLFERYMDAKTEFQDRTTLGEFVNIVTTEVDHSILGIMAPLELVVLLILTLFYTIALTFLSWQMTLISFVVFLVVSYIPRIWIREGAQIGRKLVDANTSLSSFLVGRLKSPRLARLSRTENAEKEEFSSLTQHQCARAIDNSILAAKTEVSVEPFVIALSLFFLYFSYAILHLSIEVIGLYLVVVLRLMPVIKGIISQWHAVQRWIGSIEIIEEKLNLMELNKESDSGSIELKNLENISLNNVSYCYSSANKKALKNNTIDIPPGSMTAIVGPSGSGKSTLIDLIPRLRAATSGLVKFGDFDVNAYTLSTLRGMISYVPQGPQLFNGTVSQHIRYGKLDASMEEVYEAARLAGASQFVNNMPSGFETVIGDDGSNMSGGQRQRLDLARAIVSKAQILILDEPTSGLDVESERLFRESISMIRKDKKVTIIIVTHNLENIVNADNIIVLRDGSVSEQGKHEELIVKDGWYASAWKKDT
jgi:ABC-type multidrug transport system fused ATPase/permease subunit